MAETNRGMVVMALLYREGNLWVLEWKKGRREARIKDLSKAYLLELAVEAGLVAVEGKAPVPALRVFEGSSLSR